MRALTSVLPTDIALLIGQQLMTAVQSSEGTKGIGILIAFLVASYGGTHGSAALLTALNIAYEEKEQRSLVHFYSLAMAMTFAALVLALLALGSAAALAMLQKLLPEASDAALIAGKIGGYLAMTLSAAAIIGMLYRFGPSREDARWEWISPGSAFASISWLLLTVAFSFYLSHLSNYSATYGSLAAVVALLTWMYFSAYAFLFGAELNSEIEHQTAKDSTTGMPRPLGTRGAWAADNVAYGEDVQDRPEEVREGERLTAASPTIADEDS
jgi:membrane protein